MEIAPDLDSLLLFILLIFPGLISMHIYRLLMPAKDIDWKTALLEALFYGTLNFGFCLPITIPIHRNQFSSNHLCAYIILLVIVIAIAPIFWPILIKIGFSCKWLTKKMQLPYPTAWDYYFNKRENCFVLVHLKNGEMIGGFYGPNSYSTSYPRHGSLYLEKAIKINNEGQFTKIVDGSNGLLISQDIYDYIETFEYKTENNQESENGRE